MPTPNEMRELGARGGAATAKKGSEYYRAIGAMGGRAGAGKRKPRKSPLASFSERGEMAPTRAQMHDDDVMAELDAE